MSPFHLAFPVNNLAETKDFFVRLFKSQIGRECNDWVDFDFYGHQITAHLKPEETSKAAENHVDGKNIPVRHFGIILDWDVWHELAERLKMEKIDFVIEPYIRFKDKVGEQATMFFFDPSGNALEFKSFKDKSQIFNK